LRRVGTLVLFLTILSAVASIDVARAQEPARQVEPEGQKTSKPKRPKFVTSCDAPRDLVRLATGLPAFSRNLAQGKAIEIVALGSSSTAGSGASSPQASYPARLEAELLRRFPGRDIEVHNFGTGGALARDMVERIESAVLSIKPTLVIWQTGVNDAVQDVGLVAFREVLERGIKLLKDHGVDLILVDGQYYPRSERVAGYRDYLRAMRVAAETHAIGLFPRYAIMRHMVRTGQHSPEELLAPDNFHLNDLSYGCLADLMADGIEEQLKGGRLDAANRIDFPPL
jgi:acyl-CoA thioesterase I